MVLAWTGLEDTGVTALQDLPENAVREISTSACQTPAILPTVWIAYSCPTITSVYASPASRGEGVRIDSVCARLIPVRTEERAPCPAAQHWVTPAPVSLVMQVLTVRGA